MDAQNLRRYVGVGTGTATGTGSDSETFDSRGQHRSDFQFYPTPLSLATKMWDTFESKPSQYSESVILDPSAGRGDLLAPYRAKFPSSRSSVENIDVVEIDFENQAVLRERGYSVVGHDFLQFSGLKHYTHIIMNPPFSEGAKHVLRASHILKGGELVALVNAETLKNPCDKYRKQLLQIIEDHDGRIEYVTGAFETPEAARKTTVECAIIHLIKKADYSDLSFLDTLKPDLRGGDNISDNVCGDVNADGDSSTGRTELILKEDTIKQIVTVFNAAVTAMSNEVRVLSKLQADSSYYAGLLADSILKPENEDNGPREPVIETPMEQYNRRYKALKEKAWSHVLEVTEVGKSLPSKVRSSIEKRFKDVVELEFTSANIHGFLLGLIQGRGEMNADTLLNMFDFVTLYQTGNRAWYKGWKSNDKHKTNAYRIKMTRFILPIRGSFSWIDHGTMQEFKDIDIAFSLLDGVPLGSFTGIADLFGNEDTLKRLKAGERVSSEYFDIRFYVGAGTVHYFPRNRKLIERLNLFVGRHRQWLPPQEEKVSKAFWLQYQRAEDITRQMDKMSDDHTSYAYGINRGEKADAISQMIDKAGLTLDLQMYNLLTVDKEETEDDINAPRKEADAQMDSRSKSQAPKKPSTRKAVSAQEITEKISSLKDKYRLQAS